MQKGQGQLCWTSEIQLHNKFIEILCGVGADLPGGESGRIKEPEEDSGRGRRRRRSLTRRRRRRIFKSWWGKQQEPLCKFASQRLHFIPISMYFEYVKYLFYKFPLCISSKIIRNLCWNYRLTTPWRWMTAWSGLGVKLSILCLERLVDLRRDGLAVPILIRVALNAGYIALNCLAKLYLKLIVVFRCAKKVPWLCVLEREQGRLGASIWGGSTTDLETRIWYPQCIKNDAAGRNPRPG